MARDSGGAAESLPLADVEVDDPFWGPRQETNREVTIAHQHEQLERSGCLDNFRRAAAGETGGFEGPMFVDSDAYKWLEAASYVLTTRDDPDLAARVGEVVDLVADAQADDGYLHTYFMLEEPDGRWENLNVMHELYCAGHLIEAAVAHRRATGADDLLEVAVAFADLIDRTFGPDAGEGIPGHEEVELALVKLYRVTGTGRYLDLARYFVEARGRAESPLAGELANVEEIAGAGFVHRGRPAAETSRDHFLDEDGQYDGSYAQDHAPVREQATVEGHAVRAMYLYTAVASLLQEVDDEGLRVAMERLWENVTERRMYVTGGVGSEHAHEGFTEDYDLPNETAYAETCAAVGSVFWNRRLFELTGAARYQDLLERVLYNAFLVGVSRDGTRFFYDNPLESTGEHERREWFYVACCPPNAARLLASLGGYCYGRSVEGDALYVNQFVGSRVDTEVGGRRVAFTQTSGLPREPEVTVEFTHEDAVAVDLRVRIPGWTTGVDVRVNGESVEPTRRDGYLVLDRTWEAGDAVGVSFDAPVEPVRANPRVREDAGRVALRRGPLVYCLEGVDNAAPPQELALPDPGAFEADHDEDLLGGTTVLRGPARAAAAGTWDGELYLPEEDVESERVEAVAVPYFTWGNRGAGPMAVWVPRA